MSEARGYLEANFIKGVRQGDTPGAQVIPNLLGPGRDVIMLNGAAYELLPHETPLQEGHINICEVQVVHKPLEEADDVLHPGLRDEEINP